MNSIIMIQMMNPKLKKILSNRQDEASLSLPYGTDGHRVLRYARFVHKVTEQDGVHVNNQHTYQPKARSKSDHREAGF